MGLSRHGLQRQNGILESKGLRPFWLILGAMLVSGIIALSLSYLYRHQTLSNSMTLGASLVNALVVLVIYLIFQVRSGALTTRLLPGVTSQWPRAALLLRDRAWIPAAVLALAAVLSIAGSRILYPPDDYLLSNTKNMISWSDALLMVLWVPLIEELLFRRWVGEWFQWWLPGLWGVYFSALSFGLCHAMPIWDDGATWGVPLGPFVLGICCELIFRVSNKLYGAILLHAAANATALVFFVGDPRWLKWLAALYL